MTSPASEFFRAVLFKNNGTGAYLNRVDQPVEYVGLPAGTYMLQLNYQGPEAAEIWWSPEGGGTGKPTHRICQVEADPTGTPRMSKPVKVHTVTGGALVRVTTTPRPNAGAALNSTASVEIITTPT